MTDRPYEYGKKAPHAAERDEICAQLCYNYSMKKHWSVDTTELEKDPDAYAVWRLEQAINFGIRDSKIEAGELKKYWDKLDIDPDKKRFLSLILPQ